MRQMLNLNLPRLFALAVMLAGLGLVAAPREAQAAPLAVPAGVAAPAADVTQVLYGSGHGRFVGHHHWHTRRHMKRRHHHMHHHHGLRGHHRHHHQRHHHRHRHLR